MNVVVELIAIIITTLMCIRPVKYIFSGKGNIFHFCACSFYIMQVVPMWFKVIFGVDETLIMYPNMYIAMNDEATSYIYSFFVILAEVLFALLACSLPYKAHSLNEVKGIYSKLETSKTLKKLLFCGMYVSLIAVLMAPNPDIYKEFSYFYTHRVNNLDPNRIYHYSVMGLACRVVFFCVLLYYLLNKKHKMDIFVYIAIALMTCVKGKRTLLAFGLIGILGIDIVNRRYKDNKYKLLIKTVTFLMVIVGYFLIYADITGKGSTTSFYNLYSIYFARMSNVQTAIYDMLNGGLMMTYPGQSIVYNLLFWIPRSIWEAKPVIFSKYFTAYVMGYNTININWQFQVNVWTEYIANFGILGMFLAFVPLNIVARLSEKSKSSVVYILGWAFSILYTMFGFESTVQYIGIAWGVMVFFSKMPRIKVRWR